MKNFILNLFKGKLAFLTSVRFWKVVVASALVYLGSLGTIDPGFANVIASILGFDVTIRTIDRFSENVGKK